VFTFFGFAILTDRPYRFRFVRLYMMNYIVYNCGLQWEAEGRLNRPPASEVVKC
jgi:hypothetical protein